MENYFVVGDIHGCYDQALTLLKHWNSDNQRLVFLGDYIDRGTKCLETIKLVMKLHKEYGAIAIGGNHESLFLDWMNVRDLGLYYRAGGINTILSFLRKKPSGMDESSIICEIKNTIPEVINFIQFLPNYYETESHIFVHAGVDPTKDNWKEDDEDTFRWIRDEFIYGKNQTNKIIVFGHTPTFHLHTKENGEWNADVWISPCQTKIGIDGGIVYDGLLHGLVIQPNGEYLVHSVNNILEVKTTSFQLTKG